MPVNPGDVIVIRFPSGFPKNEYADRLIELVKEAFPDNEVLALGCGIEIAVMGSGDHA